jgi:hypothetical protein
MNLLGAASAFALPAAALSTLLASIVLLGVRAWSRTMAISVSRAVARVLDVFIILLVALFLVFVLVRFVTFA